MRVEALCANSETLVHLSGSTARYRGSIQQRGVDSAPRATKVLAQVDEWRHFQ
jgi:hypothetical protein